MNALIERFFGQKHQLNKCNVIQCTEKLKCSLFTRKNSHLKETIFVQPSTIFWLCSVIPVNPCLRALWKPCKGKLAKVEVLLWVKYTTLEQLLSATPKASLIEYHVLLGNIFSLYSKTRVRRSKPFQLFDKMYMKQCFYTFL